MACRAGMTTNLTARKAYWESQHPNLHNWREYGPYSSRDEAQEAEKRLAALYGCEAHHGGDNPEEQGAQWYAYKFDY